MDTPHEAYRLAMAISLLWNFTRITNVDKMFISKQIETVDIKYEYINRRGGRRNPDEVRCLIGFMHSRLAPYRDRVPSDVEMKYSDLFSQDE